MAAVIAALMSSTAGRIAHGIQPVRHAPLPPFDPSDSFGTVHTVLPPEQIIPPFGTDPAYLIGDFGGMTIPGTFDPPLLGSPGAWDDSLIRAAGGVRITSGRWTGLWIPLLVGANTTPPPTLMTPMLVMYPADVQNAFLTEYCERGYRDFVYADEGWNMSDNGYVPTPEKLKAWAQYVITWDLRPVLWRGNALKGVDDVLRTLADAGAISFYIHGKEVDTWMSSAVYEASLREVDSWVNSRFPIGAHFSANNQRGMGYPIGAARDDFMRDWSYFNGRVHLCQQLLGQNTDETYAFYGPAQLPRSVVLTPAGLQGSTMYYARRWINLGKDSGIDGALGSGAPLSRVIHFEAMQTPQLYGLCTEEYGCLRAWEALSGTREDPRVLPVSGSMGGFRYPNGDPAPR